MEFPCTQSQYDAAITALGGAKGVKVSRDAGGKTGFVTTPKVDFEYAFNGAQLTVTVTRKHFPYGGIPDSVIASHIQDELMRVGK